MPSSITVTLANLVYFDKAQLPQPLANRLIRLAAFQNPEFYRAQPMRLSAWDKPRVIGCAENYPSLETGLRKSNVLGLTWGRVDLQNSAAWIHADQAKARRAIAVPLSPTAVQILQGERGRSPNWVFTYKGKRVGQSNTAAWKKALARACLHDLRWHDLRHTWASWHAQHGTPLHVLQEFDGWQSAEMVKVYARLSTHHLRQYVLDFHAKRKAPPERG